MAVLIKFTLALPWQVLLLSMPGIKDFYTQCCNYAENEKAHRDAVHPTALIKVGMFTPVLFCSLWSTVNKYFVACPIIRVMYQGEHGVHVA